MFQNVVRKLAASLYRPQYANVNNLWHMGVEKLYKLHKCLSYAQCQLTFDVTTVRYNRKEYSTHRWRHNGEHNRWPLPLMQQYDRASLYQDSAQIGRIIRRLKLQKRLRRGYTLLGSIRCPLFASEDTRNYPHLASQCHSWSSTAQSSAMLRIPFIFNTARIYSKYAVNAIHWFRIYLDLHKTLCYVI